MWGAATSPSAHDARDHTWGHLTSIGDLLLAAESMLSEQPAESHLHRDKGSTDKIRQQGLDLTTNLVDSAGMDTNPAADGCLQRLPVRCDYCGEVYLSDHPLRPSCDECEVEMRAQFNDSLALLIPDDEASRYEAEMERMADEAEREWRATR